MMDDEIIDDEPGGWDTLLGHPWSGSVSEAIIPQEQEVRLVNLHQLLQPKQGFLRTLLTARLWWGPLQIQAWRDGRWLIAWNGRHVYICLDKMDTVELYASFER